MKILYKLLGFTFLFSIIFCLYFIFKDHLVFGDFPAAKGSYDQYGLNNKAINKRNNPENIFLDKSKSNYDPSLAPNIVLIDLSRIPFPAIDIFGGPVAMPNLKKLSQEGLRYNNFYVNPSVKTNQYSLNTGKFYFGEKLGYYPDSASITNILKFYGYDIGVFGKFYGKIPFLKKLFADVDLFYGTNQDNFSYLSPRIYKNFELEESKVNFKEDYHFDADIISKSLDWLKKKLVIQNKDPFMIYLSPAAGDSPHQVSQKWIDDYKGVFSEGWSSIRNLSINNQKYKKILPNDAPLPFMSSAYFDWDVVGKNLKSLYLKQAEVYAGLLSHLDYQLGKLIDLVKNRKRIKNTFFIVTFGSGVSMNSGGEYGFFNMNFPNNYLSEPLKYKINNIDQLGSKSGYNNMSVFWSLVFSAPYFPLDRFVENYDSYSFIKGALLLNWPLEIKPKGIIRNYSTSIVDIFPIILNSANINVPVVFDKINQSHIDGSDISKSFNDKNIKNPDNYFSYTDKSIFFFIKSSFLFFLDLTKHPDLSIINQSKNWQIYNLIKDPVCVDNIFKEGNLSSEINLISDFLIKQKIYANRLSASMLTEDDSSYNAIKKSMIVDLSNDKSFYSDTLLKGIPSNLFLNLSEFSSITSFLIEVPGSDRVCNGVFVAQGGRHSGWVLYLKNNTPVFVYNYFGVEKYKIVSQESLSPGMSRISVDFRYDFDSRGSSGVVSLYINKKLVGKGSVDKTVPYSSYTETVDFGVDLSTQVDYEEFDDVDSTVFDCMINEIEIELYEHEKLSNAR